MPLLTLFFVIAIILAVFAFQHVLFEETDEVEYLRDKLENLRGVNEDFKEGFNSCIEYLKQYQSGVSNVTASKNVQDTSFQPAEGGAESTFSFFNIGFFINEYGGVDYFLIEDNPFTRYIWHNPNINYFEDRVIDWENTRFINLNPRLKI